MLHLLRRILLFLALGLAVIVVAFVVAVSLGIRVDLEPMRKPFEAMASTTMKRQVTLEGDIFLVPTWSVTVEANGLRIANPEGWERPDFVRLDLARLQFDVLPLLRRRVVIRELRAEGIEAIFERRADGSANWEFAGAGAEVPEAEPEPEAVADAEPETVADVEPEPSAEPASDAPPAWKALLPSAVVLEQLALHDIRAELRDAVAGVERTAALERLEGSAATDAPLEFSLSGSYDGHSFASSLKAGDPSLLVGGDAAWPLETTFEIADTRFTLAAQVDEGDWDFGDSLRFFLETARSPFAGLEDQRLGEVTLTIEGERLDSLDPVFEVSLPHWGPHRFEGRFQAFGGGHFTADVVTTVGASELTGTLSIEARATPPRIEFLLKAPSVQLDDFPLEGWSAIQSPPDEPSGRDSSTPRATGRALLSPEVMSIVDARLEVDVDRVASGRERLGEGRLSARLEKGRFRLDAFDIHVPGGSIKTRASLTPGRRSISGSLNFVIDRFDYGILARRVAPETDMRGLFAMKVDLKSTAPDAIHLIEHASGRFDAAVFPETLEAGVIDLWAVNLVAAVLPEIDSSEQSKVNCFVALMDMKDGIMTQHALLVDTSRLTVHGEAEIDFREQKVELELAPTPKRPEFFSVATPIQVEGNFEDFDIDVAPEDLLGTIIRFVTSVVHVPVRRIFATRQDPEELDTCMAALELR